MCQGSSPPLGRKKILGSNLERFPGFVVEAKEQVSVGDNGILGKK